MFAATCATSVKLVHPEPWQRSILKPLSSVELSAQLRLIWVEEAVVAVSPLGAAGGVGSVVALAVFEYAESPPLL